MAARLVLGRGLPSIMAGEPTRMETTRVARGRTAEARSGAIVLARHGEPVLSRKVKLNAAEYAAWWARYEELGVRPGQTPPPTLTALAGAADILVCSTRIRSIES